jgi:hypothetical protein
MDEKEIVERLLRKAGVNRLTASVYKDSVEIRITTPVAGRARDFAKIVTENYKIIRSGREDLVRDLKASPVVRGLTAYENMAVATRDGVTFGASIIFDRLDPPAQSQVIDIVKKHMKVT